MASDCCGHDHAWHGCRGGCIRRRRRPGDASAADWPAMTRLDLTGILTSISVPAGQLAALALGTSTASSRGDGGAARSPAPRDTSRRRSLVVAPRNVWTSTRPNIVRSPLSAALAAPRGFSNSGRTSRRASSPSLSPAAPGAVTRRPPRSTTPWVPDTIRTGDLVHRPDEAGGERRSRLGVDLSRRTDLLDRAAVHDHHSVADGQRLGLVVRDQDRRDVQLDLHAADLGAQLLSNLGVDGAQRLIEQQHSRLDRDGPGESHALLLAAGQLVRVATGHVGQPEQFEELRDPRPALALAAACARRDRTRRSRRPSCSGRARSPGRPSPSRACSWGRR